MRHNLITLGPCLYPVAAMRGESDTHWPHVQLMMNLLTHREGGVLSTFDARLRSEFILILSNQVTVY